MNEHTPTEGQMTPEPLLGDGLINRLAHEASSDATVQRVVRDHMMYMRHYYEADRAKAAQQLAEAQAKIAELEQVIYGQGYELWYANEQLAESEGTNE